MSFSPPAPDTDNDEALEALLLRHAAGSAGAALEAAGAATNHTVSSPHEEPVGELNDGPDDDEDMYVDEYDEDGIASDEDMDDDDVGDVDEDYLDEEGAKFSESAEVEATVEALWRKVVAVDEKPSAGHACSVCMEHLTCEGAHRICCIPCGHVYGRSCLERWLQRDGNQAAKCPQCGVMFADNQIISLYAQENLWGGCGRVQEVKVYVTKAMAEVVVQCERKMEATRARARTKIAKLKAEQRSSYEQVCSKLGELRDQVVEAGNERRELMQRLKAAVDRAFAGMDYLLDVKCAELKLIKEQIAAAKPSPPPPAKPAELQEEDASVQASRRIVKPNKRFYSDEWTR